MQTWVLVITLYAYSRAVGITSVPGYESLAACNAAGTDLETKTKFADTKTFYVCIPGPGK